MTKLLSRTLIALACFLLAFPAFGGPKSAGVPLPVARPDFEGTKALKETEFLFKGGVVKIPEPVRLCKRQDDAEKLISTIGVESNKIFDAYQRDAGKCLDLPKPVVLRIKRIHGIRFRGKEAHCLFGIQYIPQGKEAEPENLVPGFSAILLNTPQLRRRCIVRTNSDDLLLKTIHQM